MKFGHDYRDALRNEKYPVHWVEAAVSYKRLKRCIKQVQRELSSLGLSPHVINIIWGTASNMDVGNDLQYIFLGTSIDFKPKLVFTLRNVSLMNSDLTAEVVTYLRTLTAKPQPSEHLDQTSRLDQAIHLPKTTGDQGPLDALEITSAYNESPWNLDKRAGQHIVGFDVPDFPIEICWSGEIPLQSDREFFALLNETIVSLRNLRSREEFELKQAIVNLGQDISHLAAPTSPKSDMYEWREAFSLYIDYGIFFSAVENENESRNGFLSPTYKRLQAFFSKLQEDNFPRRFKRHESRTAIQEFKRINLALLRNLQFQELNETAVSKILKKFDKRTSLQTRKSFSELITSTSSTSTTMAKALCFEISEKLLGLVPQLNDYLCPVCFNISYKPIRLRCGHVFCIRCMVLMQRANNDHCPLCRGSVIMQADSGNLDYILMTFLNRYFPKEVKVKQRENERAAAVDQYGGHTDCQVM